jgi:signal transduction histidine kinase
MRLKPDNRRNWLRRSHRRLSSAHASLKYLTTGFLISVVTCADYIVGEEISFSIFYLVPIAYAAWFISARAGVLAAVVSAIIWYFVEVAQHPPYSQDWIPIWNATVRFGFFVGGVGLARLVRSTEARLIREVSRKTRILRAEVDRRRRLERELMEVTAREQLRMAQDLHDSLGQYLSALSFHARVLSDDLRTSQSPHAAQAERMVEIIRTTNQTIRRLDRALQVPESIERGLVAALRSVTAEFQQLTGIHCELDEREIPNTLDPFCVSMLFRIVQEALNNAVKHGNPRNVRISGVVTNGVLHVRVADDGAGLPTPAATTAGSGIRTMKLRAELIGGHVRLRANANGGCTLECILPLAVERTAGRRHNDG